MEVREIMTSPAVTVGRDEPVSAAVRLLRRYNLGALPVCDAAGGLRGIVTDRDVALRCFDEEGRGERLRIGEIMSRRVVTVRPGDSVKKAAELMAAERVRRLPVTEGRRVVGVVSLCDLARRESCRAECAAALQGISANVTAL